MTPSRHFNFKQELTGVFGKPVAENPTQAMIEAAYRFHGLNWRYLTIEVDPSDLGNAVLGARAIGFAGFNCTIPHKVAIIDHLDQLGESASLMGAVNCVVRRGDELIGENTDGRGFLESLRHRIDPRAKSIVLLGAGGAARAIGVELALAGASRITVVNRGENRGRELAQLLREKLQVHTQLAAWRGRYRVPEGTDVLINATSIGLYPAVHEQIPLNFDSVPPETVVADVIPNPPQTLFLQAGRERGCRVIDGLEMLVNQGVIGLKYWTGLEANRSVMRKALEEVFGA